MTMASLQSLQKCMQKNKPGPFQPWNLIGRVCMQRDACVRHYFLDSYSSRIMLRITGSWEEMANEDLYVGTKNVLHILYGSGGKK